MIWAWPGLFTFGNFLSFYKLQWFFWSFIYTIIFLWVGFGVYKLQVQHLFCSR